MIIPRANLVTVEPEARASFGHGGWVGCLRKEVSQAFQLLVCRTGTPCSVAPPLPPDNHALFLGFFKLALHLIVVGDGALLLVFVALAVALAGERRWGVWFGRLFNLASAAVFRDFAVRGIAGAALGRHEFGAARARVLLDALLVAVRAAGVDALLLLPDLGAGRGVARERAGAALRVNLVPLAPAVRFALLRLVDGGARLVFADSGRVAAHLIWVVKLEDARGFRAGFFRGVSAASTNLLAGPAVARLAHKVALVKDALARAVALERSAERVARQRPAFFPADAVCPGAAVGWRAVAFGGVFFALWLVRWVQARVRELIPLARGRARILVPVLVAGWRAAFFDAKGVCLAGLAVDPLAVGGLGVAFALEVQVVARERLARVPADARVVVVAALLLRGAFNILVHQVVARWVPALAFAVAATAAAAAAATRAVKVEEAAWFRAVVDCVTVVRVAGSARVGARGWAFGRAVVLGDAVVGLARAVVAGAVPAVWNAWRRRFWVPRASPKRGAVLPLPDLVARHVLVFGDAEILCLVVSAPRGRAHLTVRAKVELFARRDLAFLQALAIRACGRRGRDPAAVLWAQVLLGVLVLGARHLCTLFPALVDVGEVHAAGGGAVGLVVDQVARCL